MKKTTYILIAIVVLQFVIITIFMYAYSRTGRPWSEVYPELYAPGRYNSSDEITVEEEYEPEYQTIEILVDTCGNDFVITMSYEAKRRLGIPASGETSYDSIVIKSPEGEVIVK